MDLRMYFLRKPFLELYWRSQNPHACIITDLENRLVDPADFNRGFEPGHLQLHLTMRSEYVDERMRVALPHPGEIPMNTLTELIVDRRLLGYDPEWPIVSRDSHYVTWMELADAHLCRYLIDKNPENIEFFMHDIMGRTGKKHIV